MITNNFNELPKTRKLWIKVNNWIFMVLYEDGIWKECLTKEGSPIEYWLDMDIGEVEYLLNSICCYEVFSNQSQDERIVFADREISFANSEEIGYTLSVQIGSEDDEGYDIDLIQIKKEKLLELAEFFKKVSAQFLSDIKCGEQ